MGLLGKLRKYRLASILLSLAIISGAALGYISWKPQALEVLKRSDIEEYNRAIDFQGRGLIELAQNSFKKVAFSTKDRHLKSLAFYQLGTILGETALYQKEFSLSDRIAMLVKAVSYLKESVKADPSNEKAKYNYEYLKSLLGLVEQMAAKGDNGQEGKEGDEPSINTGYGKGDSKKGY